MKLKYIFTYVFAVFYVLNVRADDSNIKMFGKETFGYDIPKYITSAENKKVKFIINAIADHDDFPISSSSQGSVLAKIIDDIAEKYDIFINLWYYPQNLDKKIDDFEKSREKDASINGHFGVVYKEHIYSKNEYLYPSFFEDNIHIITPVNNSLDIKTKDDLKKYKGVYVKKGQKSSIILKDFKMLNIEAVETYDKAFSLLLTGKVDYIAGNYYSSQIEAYKLGIRNLVLYSKSAVWKNLLFIRITPEVYNSKVTKILKKYFASAEYKNKRDALLKEMLEIYKENTQGIVPPTYTNKEDTDKTNEI